MSAKKLDSKFGKLTILNKNPRKITDVEMANLIKSIQDDDWMLAARSIVVDENGVILGGNQRAKALLALGYTRVPDEWVVMAKHKDGSPLTEKEKERFILKDNNPEGMSGEFDYDKMMEEFEKDVIEDSGIDFSAFMGRNGEVESEFGLGGDGEGFFDDEMKSKEDEVEEGEDGEKDEALNEFIRKREAKRKDIKELMDTGFYLGLVFETIGQKKEFLEKMGIGEDEVKYGRFVEGEKVAMAAGKELTASGLHFPERRVDVRLKKLAMENEHEGEDAEEVLKGEGIPKDSELEGEGGSLTGGDGEIGGMEIGKVAKAEMKLEEVLGVLAANANMGSVMDGIMKLKIGEGVVADKGWDELSEEEKGWAVLALDFMRAAQEYVRGEGILGLGGEEDDEDFEEGEDEEYDEGEGYEDGSEGDESENEDSGEGEESV